MIAETTPEPAAKSLAESASVQDAAGHELARLQRESLYLRLALDQASEGVIILMPGHLYEGGKTYVMHASTAAHVLLGVHLAQGLRGVYLSELMGSEADFEILDDAMQLARTGGGSAECVCRLKNAMTGMAEAMKLRVRAVMTEHGRLLNYTLCFSAQEAGADEAGEQGVSGGRVVGDDEMKKAEVDAVAFSRMEGLATLAHGVVHDVNNLLGPLMVQLSEMVQVTGAEGEMREQLLTMLDGLKRARVFTGQVLNLSRVKKVERCPTNMEAVVSNTLAVCASGYNVQTDLNVERGLMWANVDAVKMAQVFQNLILNGMQAMPKGGRMFLDLCNLQLMDGNAHGLPGGEYLDIRVRDRGMGMSEETLAKLFTKGFTTKEDGNGVGLHTCMHFVREQDGLIEVTSKLGVGTEFRVLLPAVMPVQAEREGGRQDLIPLQCGSGRVLLVDDEPHLRLVAGAILKRCGYEVMEADNGDTAIDLYREQMRLGEGFDVVLMDLTLRGGLTGEETAKVILTLDAKAKMVVTSGSVTEDIQRVFLDEGFVGVLPKPYEAGALTAKVKEVCEMRV